MCLTCVITTFFCIGNNPFKEPFCKFGHNSFKSLVRLTLKILTIIDPYLSIF